LIDNPDYKPADDLYRYASFEALGLELWQVQSGSIFDNLLVTDNEFLAAEARKVIATRRDKEKKLESETKK